MYAGKFDDWATAPYPVDKCYGGGVKWLNETSPQVTLP
jgi:hypothetical protein